MFKDATKEEINQVMQEAARAAKLYKKVPLIKRKYLMHDIASKLENSTHDLISTAMRETHLPEARLKNELSRTSFQLRQYGTACARGDWMDIRIDKPNNDNVKTDLRKMQIPLGPVIVFGSSNFPFAYSTAGGDTTCALAAGCPVIVKAHPAHASTSQMVADLIAEAVKEQELPSGIFSHVHGESFEVGEMLVMHDITRAVGFTGSLNGGKQLFDWAAKRKIPIPVFSEMGSTNPVFMLPQKLESDATDLARQYASSITTNAGQFCTKPGLIIAIEGQGLTKFIHELKSQIQKVAPQKMLHTGIANAYQDHKKEAIRQESVVEIASSSVVNEIEEGEPLIASVSSSEFISNKLLRREVFGPFSLIIKCKNTKEMMEVAQVIEGQLTTTLIGTESEISREGELIDALQEICGRFILNGVPTGVTVCWAMHHGGPYPATTDSRFTSVGPDGIRRFTRPICFQNWPDTLLPDELKDGNPLKIWRMVNGELTRN